MNIIGAMNETVALAYARGMKSDPSGSSTTDFSHVDHMLNQMRDMAQMPGASYGKLCRWLGWAQACVVCAGAATLEEMKEINRRHADEARPQSQR